jgi:biopolymer transport protein ExbD
MARVLISDPRGKRNYTIALTPLADVMTQLLIFFMLTSNLTPFSMLTVQSAPEAPQVEGPAPESDTPVPAPPDPAADDTAIDGQALWTVEPGAIVVGRQRFDLSLLPQLAQALRDAGNDRVVLTVSEGARIQDIVSVLEALNDVQIEAVQIARGAS